MSMDPRERNLSWISAVVVAAVLAGLFANFPYATGYGPERMPVVYWLWYFWRFPEWQHCVLVPFIVGGLVWWKRNDLAALPVRGSNWGLAAVVFGLLLFFAGYRANIYYLGYASAHVLFAGLILWLGGWPWFRQLAFICGFLVFMWPLYFLESRIGFPLRMLMTDLCSGLLALVGIDHLQFGTALVSPADASAGLAEGEKFALEVANPCSGIRSLFALMMIGALYGYVSFRRPWQWFVMWAVALPLAIAGNVVRIMLLLAGIRLFGSEIAIGADGDMSTFHFLAGVAVFVTAIGGMLLIGRVIRIRIPIRSKSENTAELPASA